MQGQPNNKSPWDYIGGFGVVPGYTEIFRNLFGDRGDTNPANKAMPYLENAKDELHKGYDPYAAIGQDPAGYLEKLMQSYTPSKGYQLKLDEGLKAAGHSAAAGGMRGSPEDIGNSGRLAESLLGNDMQQWLDNVFKQQNLGYNASTGLAGNLSNVLGEQAGYGFQGQQEENKGFQDFLKGIFGVAGAGVGGYFGGAPGAKLGYGIGSGNSSWMK